MADGHDPPQEPAGGKWELSALIALLFPPHLPGLYWLNQAGNMNVVGLSEIRTQEEEGKMGALLGAIRRHPWPGLCYLILGTAKSHGVTLDLYFGRKVLVTGERK